jgi:hypothetical protein
MIEEVTEHEPTFVCDRCHAVKPCDYDSLCAHGQPYMVDAHIYSLCTSCSSGLAEIAGAYVDGAPVSVQDDGGSYTWRWPEVPEEGHANAN